MANIIDQALDGDGLDWDIAAVWLSQANAGKENGDPHWEWDCNFKLDFDGGLLTVSSRFYPPLGHYGDTWDGKVTVSFMGKPILEKQFDCPTLEQLHKEVEEFINVYANSIKEKLSI